MYIQFPAGEGGGIFCVCLASNFNFEFYPEKWEEEGGQEISGSGLASTLLQQQHARRGSRKSAARTPLLLLLHPQGAGCHSPCSSCQLPAAPVTITAAASQRWEWNRRLFDIFNNEFIDRHCRSLIGYKSGLIGLS